MLYPLEILAVGTLWFWIVLVGSAIFVSTLTDKRAFGGASFVAFLTIAILVMFGNLNPFTWLAENPWTGVLCVLGYIAAGMAWAIIKWFFWLHKIRRIYEKARAEFGRPMTDTNAAHFSGLLRRYGVHFSFPPQVTDHKASIVAWMAFWPASMVWTLVNDPVRRIFEHTYNAMRSTMQSMADRMFRDAKDLREKG